MRRECLATPPIARPPIRCESRCGTWSFSATPQDETALRPTRLGNTLAAGAEYPWTIYAMDGLLWWSHLTPVLPSYVSNPIEGAQARLLGLLNLSLVFGVVACEAVVVLGLVGQQWTAALGMAVVAVCWPGSATWRLSARLLR